MFDIKKAVISAPFGIYCPIPNTTRTVGTYTYEARPGAVKNAIKTVRYTRRGIVNKIGLRNPGIKSIDFDKCRDKIISIGGITPLDWLNVILSVPEWATVEINASCPNIDSKVDFDMMLYLIEVAYERFDRVIVKLPPTMHIAGRDALNLFHSAYEIGIRYFTCCNTIKTERGGLSGRDIQTIAFPIIRHIKRHDPKTTVIASGGIYLRSDVMSYKMAGADHFSLGTIFLHSPWNIPSVLAEINKCTA